MAESQAVWGIDIGQAGLKAVRLKYAEAAGQVLAVAFDYIPHPKILSQPDAIPDELIRQALASFLERNEVKGDKVVISVPGEKALIRFIQLPPVEQGKVNQIIEYEARQQIPFPLEDVCRGQQILAKADDESGFLLDAEVLLFAMKRDQVFQHLKPFTEQQVEVDLVQTTPLALYSFLSYDQMGLRADDDADGLDEYSIVLDMGADSTTLLISNGEKMWIRNVAIGGNHFTRALTKEMKLTFAKAEHLKCNATKSPDPRAVFQALRPVFNDYVSEIQRSIGYFSSVNRDAKITKVLGLGNGFKLAGLQKFLQQNLQYEVEKVDTFQSAVGDAVLNAPLFEENVLSFAVPYGLALQGMGLSRISDDLLPGEIRLQRKIREKKPWAVLTAAALLLGLALSAFGYARENKSVTGKEWDNAVTVATRVKSEADRMTGEYNKLEGQFKEIKGLQDLLVKPAEDRERWPELHKAIIAALPRDPADKFSDAEITKKNRIKVYACTAQKLPDVKAWYDQLQARDKTPMREEDRNNPPTGEGYVFTLKCYHYHEEFEADGKKKKDSYWRNWAQKAFVDNLQKWRVDRDRPIPVRELGITHPLITEAEREVRFEFYTDRRKVQLARASGRFGTVGDGSDGSDGAGRFVPPSNGNNGSAAPQLRSSGAGGGQSSQFDSRQFGGRGSDSSNPGSESKDADLGDSIKIPLTKFTVQFVWQPVTGEAREKFYFLYKYFQSAAKGQYSQTAAAEFVSKATSSKLTVSAEEYDRFVKYHFAPAAPKTAEPAPAAQ